MPCFHPLKGWRSRVRSDNGRRGIVFNPSQGLLDMPLSVPCGQCIGCRLERSRQWAIRCYHEASLHEKNCFITLTYDDAHLPENKSLIMKHYQDFMKRLRKEYGEGIRFFACGEYGDKTHRPHYHALLFGHAFPDQRLHSQNHGHKLYRSESLERLWPDGFSSIGQVNWSTASYVARYVLKKATGELAGMYEGVEEPFVLMSRRPGLGSAWYAANETDVYPRGTIIVGEGKERRPPRFFENKYRQSNPMGHAMLKATRRASSVYIPPHEVGERLRAKNLIAKSRVSNLKSSI